MGYKELARAIKEGYNDLKKDTEYKLHLVTWNDKLGTSEITVENDAGFRAIIIGDTRGMCKARGYMYLFYTNDNNVSFPTIKEIERRLKIVANKEILTDEDADYFDWEIYRTFKSIGILLYNDFFLRRLSVLCNFCLKLTNAFFPKMKVRSTVTYRFLISHFYTS